MQILHIYILMTQKYIFKLKNTKNKEIIKQNIFFLT